MGFLLGVRPCFLCSIAVENKKQGLTPVPRLFHCEPVPVTVATPVIRFGEPMLLCSLVTRPPASMLSVPLPRVPTPR